MESAVSLEVPNKVDYESGPNWGTIEEKKQEYIMEKIIHEAKRLWTLAITNKKATAVVIVAVIIIYHLATK